jgi:DnaK suppressor protein
MKAPAAVLHTVPMDTDEARALLQRERERIERTLAEISRREDDDDPDPFEASDAGADMVETEIGEGLAERLQEELEAVQRAERRLAEGTYGISVESGEPIPEARLQTIPWAERTAEEQARFGG